jgi:hypothetical protein
MPPSRVICLTVWIGEASLGCHPMFTRSVPTASDAAVSSRGTKVGLPVLGKAGNGKSADMVSQGAWRRLHSSHESGSRPVVPGLRHSGDHRDECQNFSVRAGVIPAHDGWGTTASCSVAEAIRAPVRSTGHGRDEQRGLLQAS